MRARLGDLKLVHRLVQFAALRTRDPDVLGFFEALLDGLPEIAAGDDTMPIVFPLSQQAVNTAHCLIKIAYYSEDSDERLDELVARAGALQALLPPLAKVSLPGIPDDRAAIA